MSGAPPVMRITNVPQPIRWRTLDRYAMRIGYEGESYETFMRLLRALDNEFLKVAAEKRSGVAADEDDHDGE